MIAYNLTRSDICYRHDAFTAGLTACGYEVRTRGPEGGPGRVLLIWSRYGEYHRLACEFEAKGGRVLVAENGYLAPGGISPHDQNPREWFALGRGVHNDSAAIPEGGPERWAALGVDLKPWRTDGGHIVVCPNRSFGTPGRIMPPNWTNETVAKLQKLTKREIRVRQHPGNEPPKRPLAEDLVGAWAMVVWLSTAGVHSLIAGVPTICCSPFWICKDIAGTSLDQINDPPMIERMPTMQRMAWGQWSIEEIISGRPFKELLK